MIKKYGFNNKKTRSNLGTAIMTSTRKSPTCLATSFTVEGVKWTIHNHDDDINDPSCPHMHAIGKPWKLDLYTGAIYNKNTGKYLGTIKYKDLLAIWRAKGVLKVILAERAIYEELHKKDPMRYPVLPELIIKPSNSLQRNRNISLYRRRSKSFMQLKAASPVFSLQRRFSKR